jgi:hypothetical protein
MKYFFITFFYFSVIFSAVEYFSQALKNEFLEGECFDQHVSEPNKCFKISNTGTLKLSFQIPEL